LTVENILVLYEWIYFAGVVVVAAAAKVPFWWRIRIKPMGYAEGEFWTHVEPMMISKGVQADMTDAFDVNTTVAGSIAMLIADLRGLFFHVVSDSTVPRVVFPLQPTNVGSKVVSANNVIGNPGKYDVGVEIGTPDIPGIGAGGNDIQTATITVAYILNPKVAVL
jgi:hypothetical protein